ncbi:endonuclease/exonuclease/phosphatase family protein [bacterium]|nr:endonuclease/exonuclease/phosphatase family protein [bacterium]
MSNLFTLATWNLEWAKPAKRDAIRDRIGAWQSDILVVTEGDHGVLPSGGHVADGGTTWGYPVVKAERRKVILWSRWPLEHVSTDVPTDVRCGRLVDATVASPVGPVRVLAVCIPWRDAHVRTGIDPHGRPWREHRRFVAHLGDVIAGHPVGTPLVVMGDFNQRLPRARQPAEVHGALVAALGPLTVVTAGANPLPGLSRREVDHVAISDDLVAEEVFGVDRHDAGRTLSDHDAVIARVRGVKIPAASVPRESEA